MREATVEFWMVSSATLKQSGPAFLAWINCIPARDAIHEAASRRRARYFHAEQLKLALMALP